MSDLQVDEYLKKLPNPDQIRDRIAEIDDERKALVELLKVSRKRLPQRGEPAR